MTTHIITLSSREFNQDTSRAKQAARKDPVFITNRGRLAHVLLAIEDYRKLAAIRMSDRPLRICSHFLERKTLNQPIAPVGCLPMALTSR